MPGKTTETIFINSVFGGLQSSRFFAGEGQYAAGIGFDPFMALSDAVGDRLTSGVLRPTAYEDFSGANVNADVIKVITNPKDNKTYVVLKNGRLISYDNALATETLVGTVTGGNAEGAAYYNNYIYIFGTGASNDDVSRYGPLDNSPSLTNGVWTGATLGSQTALVDTTYPTYRGGGTLPNHWAHAHVDNKLYFCDFADGKGYIHFIKTQKGTDEGDTDDGSVYGALDLPFGFMPTCIASLNNDIAVGAIQTSDSDVDQGKANLFLFDTTSESFYAQIPVPDPLITALWNNNGILHTFSGQVSTGTDVSNGYRVGAYLGGQQITTQYLSEVGAPPLPGAVEDFGDMLIWGTFTQIPTTDPDNPEYFAVAMAMGSKSPQFPSGVHCIANSTATATAGDGVVTALQIVQQDGFSHPKFIMGHRDSGGQGIDEMGTTYGTSVFRKSVSVGRKFTIERIRLNLGDAVGANMTITPKIFLDNYSSSSTDGLTVINDTNYADGQRYVEYYPTISGQQNFTLELRWSGSALLPVLLPVEIDFRIETD